MYKRLFSSYTYKRFPIRTIPSNYRVPNVLRRVRRNSYCKSTTPYYGGGDGGCDVGVGLHDVAIRLFKYNYAIMISCMYIYRYIENVYYYII